MGTGKDLSVLLIRLSSLGDIARLLPSAKALKKCGYSRVCLTVEDRFASITDIFPVVDEVFPYPRKSLDSPSRSPLSWMSGIKGYIKKLRGEHFDIALDLHGIVRSAVVCAMSGAGRTIGFGPGCSKEMSHHFYGETIPELDCSNISRYERYAAGISYLGVESDSEDYLMPAPGVEAENAVSEFLTENKLEQQGYLFAFMGASRAQAVKRWPLARFIELASEAYERDGLHTVLGWGPDERDLLHGIKPKDFLHIAPDWNLRELVTGIYSSRAFVGGDTGAMHLAALMGIPTIAVYGPTDPVINRPFGNRYAQVIGRGIDSFCEGESCSHERCMGRIKTDDVYTAIKALFEEIEN